METFLFLVTYITNLAGFYIIKSNRRIGKEKKSVYDVLNAYLENGLKIILHKIPEVKTVSCGLWVKQGSSYESDEFNGLSHLAEHLLMNAEDVINEQYKYLIAEITDNGVMYNAATTKEYTCFHFTGLANTLETCICALAHIAMKNRNFENENFENEKKVVLQEATGFYSSFQQIKERTSQALWGNMGTGKIIMGNMNNIREATPEQIKGLVRRAYVPENTSIVVIGNIEYMHVLELIEREFSCWEDVKKETEEEAVDSTPGIYINKGSGVSTVLSIGFRSPGYDDQRRLPTEMMVRILGGGGFQSRIVKEIRTKRGLAYTVGGFASFYRKRGTLGFTVVCDKQKSIEAAKAMSKVLAETRINGFLEEEIIREKKVMETNMLLSVDNMTEHLRYIGKCGAMDINFYIENEIRAIKKISKADVDRAARQLLVENNMGFAAIGVVVTNACNFRCEYCVQEHEIKNLSSNAEHNILEFIKNNAKIKRNITISWFGGEPLLKFADIKRMLHKACQYGDEYGCKITSDITTNGYLLNEQNIREMKQLNVKSIQITIDGDRESHNKRRYLAGAGETYDKIKENLIKVSEQNIFVILRINIDEKNVDTATNILSEIPEQYRSNIAVNVANLYQIKDKISTYQIYKKAIELGYQYIERKNQYIACHTCFSEGYVVDTDANVIICANAVEDKILGRIDEKGKVCITNPKVRYQLKTASMIKNPNCRKCIQLPFCISTCKKAIYKENVICQGKRANGLSIEEIAKLDYLYDKKCMEYREKTA